VGQAARGRTLASALAASVAFLYHPPTVYSFWLVFVALALWRREWRALGVLVCAVSVLLVAAKFQVDVSEKQVFWARIDAPWEAPGSECVRHTTGCPPGRWRCTGNTRFCGCFPWWRTGGCDPASRAGRFLLGMPVIGMLSLPASYLLLEAARVGAYSAFQPARALLFVTAFAVIWRIGGGRAAAMARSMEAAVWVRGRVRGSHARASGDGALAGKANWGAGGWTGDLGHGGDAG